MSSQSNAATAGIIALASVLYAHLLSTIDLLITAMLYAWQLSSKPLYSRVNMCVPPQHRFRSNDSIEVFVLQASSSTIMRSRSVGK